MLTRLKVTGLRGIKEGEVAPLAPVTVLLGPNGSGKSTLLEAAGVACAGTRADLAFLALTQREWLGPDSVQYWFNSGSAKIEFLLLDGTSEHPLGVLVSPPSKTEFVLRSSLSPLNFTASFNEDGMATPRNGPPLLPFAFYGPALDRPAGAQQRFSSAHFSSKLRDALARIKLSPWYDTFFEYLQTVKPGLVSIESIAMGERDEPFLFEKNGKRQGYPLAFAGDGFRRALLMTATLAEAKGGVAAMDEPEAYAHPRMFPTLTSLIRQATDDGTQVMIATHSLEFVRALAGQFEDLRERLCVVGLTMDQGILDPIVLTGADAYRRVVELSDDLRL